MANGNNLINKHGCNHEGVDYWYKKELNGYTECCEYGNECEGHKEIKTKEEESLHDLVENGFFNEELAIEFIKLVKKNKIRHITINY